MRCRPSQWCWVPAALSERRTSGRADRPRRGRLRRSQRRPPRRDLGGLRRRSDVARRVPTDRSRTTQPRRRDFGRGGRHRRQDRRAAGARPPTASLLSVPAPCLATPGAEVRASPDEGARRPLAERHHRNRRDRRADRADVRRPVVARAAAVDLRGRPRARRPGGVRTRWARHPGRCRRAGVVIDPRVLPSGPARRSTLRRRGRALPDERRPRCGVSIRHGRDRLADVGDPSRARRPAAQRTADARPPSRQRGGSHPWLGCRGPHVPADVGRRVGDGSQLDGSRAPDQRRPKQRSRRPATDSPTHAWPPGSSCSERCRRRNPARSST